MDGRVALADWRVPAATYITDSDGVRGRGTTPIQLVRAEVRLTALDTDEMSYALLSAFDRGSCSAGAVSEVGNSLNCYGAIHPAWVHGAGFLPLGGVL